VKKKESKKSRKKSSKKQKKLWGLEVLTFNKAVQPYMDQDYVHKLDDKSKAWLSKFNEEYYGNTFKDGRGPINLHLKQDRKLVYDQTNSRNRDMYNQRYRMYEEIDWSGMDYYGTPSPEDAFIEALDKKKRIKAFVEDSMELESNQEFIQTLTRFVFNIGE
jgi:hypothetical protein